jgi:membrane-associated phospholipid phosphatase
VLAALFVLLSAAGVATAQQQEPTPGDGRRTVAQLPANLFRATVGVFSTPNARPFLVGTAATGVAAIFDDAIVDALADGSNDFSRVVENGSEPLWAAAAVGVVFAAGRFTHGSRFRAATYDWLDACLVTGGYTALLKWTVRRERPNGSDTKSFPSGHTSNAFALAAVADRHYGWKMAIPAYGVAALVGLSRLQQNGHYLSDVAAGATLGYIVGRTVVRLNSRPAPPGRARLDISPAIGRRARLIIVRVSY